MKNAPKFKVAPTSVPGFSLLQWSEPGSRFPRSVQMETDIAAHLAAAGNAYNTLTTGLREIAWSRSGEVGQILARDTLQACDLPL